MLAPEGSPSGFPDPNMPAGHDWDGCNDDVVFHRLSVRDGKLMLPDGMNYRVLVLPGGSEMTPELLQKLQSLAESGATIVGPEPARSPSFRGYPQCDAQVKTMADGLWQSGKISDRPLPEVFAAMNLPPDFECVDPAAGFQYIHRATDDHDIYFISNQHPDYAESDCLFRVSGKVPELWHPDTGKVERVAAYSEENGRTRVHLRLDPVGSVFVVFHGAPPATHAIALSGSDVKPTPGPSDQLQITRASWESIADPSYAADVTRKVAGLIKDGKLSLPVDIPHLGEPAPMQRKRLRLDYVFNGKPASVTVEEGGEVRIPVSNDRAEFGAAKLETDAAGALELEAWTAGTFAVEKNDGTRAQVQVGDVPAPVTLTGPWQVSFPPKLGAPARATFDELTSWSDRPETGVKYFSGTATYAQTFSVPPALLGPGRRLYLDLGAVQVLAQVKVNGQELGILWKPPFGVDVTNAVHPGANDLEVKVTNLWVNRLIGDEQLPPDCDWTNPAAPDSGMKEWPQWLLDDQPSPTGRIAFAAWHLWHKDDPLKESGLLGPVVLVPSIVQPVR